MLHNPRFNLLITGCNDSMIWYAGKVGEIVPFFGAFSDQWKSLDESGCVNVVRFKDAVLLDGYPLDDKVMANPIPADIALALIEAGAKYAFEALGQCGQTIPEDECLDVLNHLRMEGKLL